MYTDEQKDILMDNITDLLRLIGKSTIYYANFELENEITEIPDPLSTFKKYAHTGIRNIKIHLRLRSD